MKKVTIYSDGSARSNPDGPGGYGAIVLHHDEPELDKTLMCGYNPTTNNRMELMGAIAALESLTEPSEVDLHSDSQYVINAFNKNWLVSWQKNGWKTSSKQPVKNRDLWERLLKAVAPHKVTFEWVKGHATSELNNAVDELAVKAALATENMKKPNMEGNVTESAPIVTMWNVAEEPVPGTLGTREKAATKTSTRKTTPATGEMMESNLPINIKLLSPLAKVPTRGSLGAAGYDIYAATDEEIMVAPHATVKIPTGFAMKIPHGYYAAVVARSGLSSKRGLRPVQGSATIDEDYTGEWFVPLHNDTNEPQTIAAGERIAQAIFQRYYVADFTQVDELENTERGAGGFGSTGTK